MKIWLTWKLQDFVVLKILNILVQKLFRNQIIDKKVMAVFQRQYAATRFVEKLLVHFYTVCCSKNVLTLVVINQFENFVWLQWKGSLPKFAQNLDYMKISILGVTMIIDVHTLELELNFPKFLPAFLCLFAKAILPKVFH